MELRFSGSKFYFGFPSENAVFTAVPKVKPVLGFLDQDNCVLYMVVAYSVQNKTQNYNSLASIAIIILAGNLKSRGELSVRVRGKRRAQ